MYIVYACMHVLTTCSNIFHDASAHITHAYMHVHQRCIDAYTSACLCCRVVCEAQEQKAMVKSFSGRNVSRESLYKSFLVSSITSIYTRDRSFSHIQRQKCVQRNSLPWLVEGQVQVGNTSCQRLIVTRASRQLPTCQNGQKHKIPSSC